MLLELQRGTGNSRRGRTTELGLSSRGVARGRAAGRGRRAPWTSRSWPAPAVRFRVTTAAGCRRRGGEGRKGRVVRGERNRRAARGKISRGGGEGARRGEGARHG
jgi:hypothetical protein